MTRHSTRSLSRVAGLLPLLALCVVMGAVASAAVRPGVDPGPARGQNKGDGQSTGNDSPALLFTEQPAILIVIDGEPVYRAVAGTNLQRIINTRPFIVRDTAGIHYLKILDGWMEAYSLTGLWSVAGVPPPGAVQALQHTAAATAVDLLDGPTGTRGVARTLDVDAAPAIFVSTEPAALIVTDGPPRFVTLEGTSLEYVENTTANVFKEPTDEELYVLTAGRWYRAWRTAGPWQVVASDELPADIAAIPDSSPVWHGDHAVRVQAGGDNGQAGGRGR